MYREIVETFRPETGPTGQESRTRKTMSKSLITLLLAFFLAGPAWPQEEPSGSDTEDPETTEAAEIDAAEEIDDSDLDEQSYEEDDDDFVPSEEIPADEPIPFPSNI
jgi:hypothetical protein